MDNPSTPKPILPSAAPASNPGNSGNPSHTTANSPHAPTRMPIPPQRNAKVVLLAGAGLFILALVIVMGLMGGKKTPKPESLAINDPNNLGAATTQPADPLTQFPPPNQLPLTPGSTPSTGATTGTPSSTGYPAGGPLVGNPPTDRLLIDPPGSSLTNTQNPPSSTRTTGNLVSTDANRSSSALPTGNTAKKTYVVQAGDTLSSIARKQYGDSRAWNAIIAANPGLNPNRLRVGATIQLPAQASGRNLSLTATGNDHAATRSRATAQSKSITVREGDTLYAIARREYGNGEQWDLIYKANKGRLRNPDQIPVGTRLILPPKPST